jgi:hypothetical protein
VQVLSEKVDVLRLTFYTSPVSIVLLLPFFAAFEAKELAAYLAAEGHTVWWWIAAGGINAVAYNLVHYLLIQTTSAVTTPVIGSIKARRPPGVLAPQRCRAPSPVDPSSLPRRSPGGSAVSSAQAHWHALPFFFSVSVEMLCLLFPPSLYMGFFG